MRNVPKLVGFVGGGRVGGKFGYPAVLLSVCSSQMQALSQVLCAKMGVAWHIIGAGEVSET